mmetsp:Transcript_76526/g.222289  ORF Transcript_76526/g.222289 Transcript_76526/m.222289 type:complete len:111 (-) Transcript_76526:116-448(-)
MGCGGSKRQAQSTQCANGHVTVNSRVQTQYTRAEGGDDQWYQGTIKAVYADGTVKILYDDGDKWTGHAGSVWLLQAGPPMGAPMGAPMEGGQVYQAQPIQAQVIQAQVVG